MHKFAALDEQLQCLANVPFPCAMTMCRPRVSCVTKAIVHAVMGLQDRNFD